MLIFNILIKFRNKISFQKAKFNKERQLKKKTKIIRVNFKISENYIEIKLKNSEAQSSIK
jgi:hypothetical protein